MATLVHDDLDRRGARCVAAARPPGRAYGVPRPAAGDYLFARAFAELGETGDRARSRYARRRCALPRARRGDAARCRRTTRTRRVDAYIARCALKTAKLFEAACLLGRRRGAARRVRRHARDRVPDRRRHPRLRGPDAGDGQDRRHRSSRRHPDAAAAPCGAAGRVVRRALAGGPLDGALVHVAATDALARSRDVALDYAAGAPHLPRRPAAPRGARGADLRRRGPGGT